MSPLDAIRAVMASNLAGPRCHVMMAMATHVNAQGIAFPSALMLADETGLTDRGVRNIISEMVEIGVLVETGRTSRGVRKYRLDLAALALVAPPAKQRRSTPANRRSRAARSEHHSDRNAIPTDTGTTFRPEPECHSDRDRNAIPTEEVIEEATEEDTPPGAPPGTPDPCPEVAAWMAVWFASAGEPHPGLVRTERRVLREMAVVAGSRLEDAIAVYLAAEIRGEVWPTDQAPSPRRMRTDLTKWLLRAAAPPAQHAQREVEPATGVDWRLRPDGVGWVLLADGIAWPEGAGGAERVAAKVAELAQAHVIDTATADRLTAELGARDPPAPRVH